MRRNRRAFQIAGAIFLVSFIPLVSQFQLAGVFASLLPALFCFIASGAIGGADLKLQRAQRALRKYVSPSEVQISGMGVNAFWDGEPNGNISWSQIEAVFIEIKQQGFIEVPWWHLSGKDKGVTFPSDSRGIENLLDQLRANISGFDTKESAIQIFNAMSAFDGLFSIWEKQPNPTVHTDSAPAALRR